MQQNLETQFYKELLDKYEQKLERKLKIEELQRQQEELCIQKERIRKNEEERIRVQLEKEKLYKKQELLNKEHYELPHFTKEEIEAFQDKFWDEYRCIDKEERTAYERKYFPSGLPQWFMKKKLKREEKEIEAELKQEKSKIIKHNENSKENNDGFIQLTLL
ncbi:MULTISPECIES: hypothetical protein [Bacillus cereus group]|uniref:hypothetical protein n=1 Tax=Bacillus cereus group TaxID=86661 RepID=UPI00033067C5|nr:hypothetical protein [Bacillus cereus]EOQ22693.1 hypothetical protein KQ1_05693 [Bacillus cereus BAG3O-1]HDR8173749.1 hypothetical protein [Bacillus thuringiensis]